MRGRYDGVADIGPTRVADMFVPPDGVFLVVRDGEGRAIGCGGICRFDDARAELKRMYVVPDSRGLGLGRRLLVELELDHELAGLLRDAGLVLQDRCLERDPAPGLRLDLEVGLAGAVESTGTRGLDDDDHRRPQGLRPHRRGE